MKQFFEHLIFIVNGFLEQRQKLMVCFLLLLSIVVAGMEALTVYLVLPLFGFLNSPESFDFSTFFPPQISSFMLGFGNPGPSLMLAVVFIFFLKAIVASATAIFKFSIVTDIKRSITLKIYGRYLRKNLAFIRSVESGVLTNNLTVGVSLLTNGILMHSFSATIELFQIVAMIFVLALTMPVYTLTAAALMGVLGFLFILATRVRLRKAADLRQIAEARKFTLLDESFDSIQEMRVYGSEQYFYDRLRGTENELRRSYLTIGVLQDLPRHYLELFAIICIGTIFFLITFISPNSTDMLAIQAVYGAALIKVAPSLHRLIGHINNIKYAKPVIEEIKEHMPVSDGRYPILETKLKKRNVSIESVVFSNVSYRYVDRSKPALQQFNAKFERGEFVAIAGESGAGKTTILNLLTGFLDPSAGRVLINGEEVGDLQQFMTGRIGYVPQRPAIIDASILENILFGIALNDVDRGLISTVLKQVNMADAVAAMPNGVDTQVGSKGKGLSGGQAQRIALARALYRSPEILILDESTNALDEENEALFWESLQNRDRRQIVVAVSHSPSVLEYCDKVVAV